MPVPSLGDIKERKIVQWGLAYLAGAWLVLQVVVALGGVYGWPGWLLRAVPVVLVAGFFGALVVAWYHGEQGRQRVGGVELGILAVLLGLAGLGVAIVGPEGDAESGAVPVAQAGPGVDQTAIAELPFEALQEDEEYFADGLTEELLAILARSPTLRVAARTSAFSFKGSEASADSVGRALQVAHLVEGTVRRSGDRVRIAARLIDTETGLQEWAETYDRDLADVFAIQEDIARSVAFQLNALLGFTPTRGTEDPEAYELALRGRQLFEQGGNRRQIGPELVRLFEAALARDSAYAFAWAGVAHGRRFIGEREAAIEAAERALSLDPDEGWAHHLLGALLNDPADRRYHYEKALAANPSDARLMGRLSYILLLLGEMEEAVRIAGQAVSVDPLSVDALVYGSNTYASAGRYPQALEWAREAVALDSLHHLGLYNLAGMLSLTNQTDEALRVIERGRDLYPTSTFLPAGAAFAYARSGRRAEAERILEDQEWNHHYITAAVETALGDPDAAFAALDQSIAAQENATAELSFDYWFTPLHSDPRWEETVARAARQRDAAD